MGAEFHRLLSQPLHSPLLVKLVSTAGIREEVQGLCPFLFQIIKGLGKKHFSDAGSPRTLIHSKETDFRVKSISCIFQQFFVRLVEGTEKFTDSSSGFRCKQQRNGPELSQGAAKGEFRNGFFTPGQNNSQHLSIHSRDTGKCRPQQTGTQIQPCHMLCILRIAAQRVVFPRLAYDILYKWIILSCDRAQCNMF